MNKFEQFSFLPSLQQSLEEKRLTDPTEIQSGAIPLLLSGQSMVGVAETGSGKTLAYALPILHLLKKMEVDGNPVSEEGKPRACVVVPTRELGEQVSRVFKPFTHTTRLRVRTLLGGSAFDVARRGVQGSFEILVATPGRLLRLLHTGLLSLEDVRLLVFDEADQMLDQGFLPDAEKILAACPQDCQRALFSATVSPKVQNFISNRFEGVQTLRSQGSHRVVQSLQTINQAVIEGKRFPLLEKILGQKADGGTLIFTNTRAQCDKLITELKEAGYTCLVYRGEMDKVERRKNLKAFREGKAELLISTDLASRGLDIDHVGRVINYHLPTQMENYLHRVGRTARAGRSGQVINLVTERDAPLVAAFGTVRPQAPGERASKASGAEWPSAPRHSSTRPERAKVRPLQTPLEAPVIAHSRPRPLIGAKTKQKSKPRQR